MMQDMNIWWLCVGFDIDGEVLLDINIGTVEIRSCTPRVFLNANVGFLE